MNHPPGVVVHGQGSFPEALRRLLSVPEPEDEDPDATPLVLVSRLDEIPAIKEGLVTNGHRLIVSVSVWRSWIFVGPTWSPGRRGCPRCLLLRVTDSSLGPERRQHEQLGALPGQGIDMAGSGPGVPSLVARYVSAHLDEVLRTIQDSEPERAAWSRVTVLGSQSLEAVQHELIPVANCPICGPPPRSTLPELNEDVPLIKPDPETLRLRVVDVDELSRHISPLGLFRDLKIDLQSPFGASSIELPEIEGRPREPAMGRAESYRQSRAIAILEGLERYCGLHRGGPRLRVRAAFQDLADRAIHPPSFGLHLPESYALPDFPYVPFSEDLVLDWVEAYSFARREPVLVPERAAFWGPRYDKEPTLFYETSNGCALGSCTEEAILHGLRELVERDSFLLTWYLRLKLPEIDLRRRVDSELRGLLRKSELFANCTFRAFLSTMEHGMPSVWLTAVGNDPGGPAVLGGAGAHPDPRKAISGAIEELTKLFLAVAHYYPERREDAVPMLEDSSLVEKLEHHPAVNCLPEARDRFAFLLDRETEPMAISDIPHGTTRKKGEDGMDLRQDLTSVVEGILESEMDVLVVDQTMPELEPLDLCCVKVLVPGMIPITFGHTRRRTVNLPRLEEPARLPYESALPAGMEPGAIPHPFH